VLGVGNKPSDYLPEDVEDVAALADLAWDIAARKRAEEQVRASAAWARSLLEASLDPLVTISPEGQITDVNAATEVATGVPRERLVGTDFADYFTEPDDARAGYRKVLAEGAVRDYPLTIRHASGSTTDVLYNASTLRGEDGAVLGVFAAARDVSEVHALQAQLAMASRLAAMGSLVAGVAHEVKNPLTAALADLELVLPGVRLVRERLDGHGPLDRSAEARFLDQVIEQLEDVQEGARRIERLVKELKVFAQPDQRRTRVRLVDVVEKAMRWLPASVGKSATVQVENAGPPDVVAAFGQIEQVVVNLVTNAAKATKPGRAGLVIIRIGPGSPGMARLEVVDHGTGIEPRLLRRIFEPFVRVGEEGRTTGLGLAVCHSIAISHGGTLTAESALGEGSRFRMELPAAGDAAAPEPHQEAPDSSASGGLL
jgi:PAS domain S-box-containing protein